MPPDDGSCWQGSRHARKGAGFCELTLLSTKAAPRTMLLLATADGERCAESWSTPQALAASSVGRGCSSCSSCMSVVAATLPALSLVLLNSLRVLEGRRAEGMSDSRLPMNAGSN